MRLPKILLLIVPCSVI